MKKKTSAKSANFADSGARPEYDFSGGVRGKYTKTLREEGPDHNKIFTVGVYLETELVTEGAGKSKQEAEQDAAQKALSLKSW